MRQQFMNRSTTLRYARLGRDDGSCAHMQKIRVGCPCSPAKSARSTCAGCMIDYRVNLNLQTSGPDPDPIFDIFSGCGSSLNWDGYCNPEVDEISSSNRGKPASTSGASARPEPNHAIRDRVPVSVRKRGRRTLVAVPAGAAPVPERRRVGNAMVQALARDIRWRKPLESASTAPSRSSPRLKRSIRPTLGRHSLAKTSVRTASLI